MHAFRQFLLLLALAACSRAPSGTVTLGAAGPSSEPYGEANRKGIQLAVDEINASPAWSAARHLEINFQDDSASGVVASAIAQSFVDSTRVVAVIGHVNSSAMLSAARIYDKHLAAVETTATSPSLTGISPWAFRVIPSDSANGMAIAKFANKRGRKRAAILYENNSYGRGLADNFRKSWYKLEKPDIVFVAGTDASGLAFLKEARRQQFTADLVDGDGWQTLAPSPLAEGVYVGAPFSAQDPRPEVQAFVASYIKKYNAAPDGNAALAYDATKLLAQAVQNVGADRVKIRDYLAGLTEATEYHGVTGTIRFRPDGDPIGKFIRLTRVHQGALQVETDQ